MELEFELNSSSPFYHVVKKIIQLGNTPELVLRSSHPFYPLANFVQQLNSPNPPSVSSLADIQNIYHLTFASPRKINWTSLDLQELESYIEFIEKNMAEFAVSNCHFAYQRIIRLILVVFQDIYALSNMKGSKRHFKNTMEKKICELLISLSVFYRTHEVDLQLAEAYAREAITMLEEMPGQFGKEAKNNKLLVQMNLALIYMRLGYTGSTLKMLSEASVNQVYNVDFIDQYLLLLEGYQAVIEYFHTKDLLVSIILCRDLSSLKTLYAKGIANDRILGKITTAQYNTFFKVHQEIDKKTPALVLKTHQAYQAKLFQEVQSNKNCSIIRSIEFDSENYKIQLKFSDDMEDNIIQKAFRFNKIIFTPYSTNEDIQYIFNVDTVTSQRLEKICLYIDKIKQSETKKLEEVNQKRSIKENSAEVNSILVVDSKPIFVYMSDAQSYSDPVFFKESQPALPLVSVAKNKQKKTDSNNKNPINHQVTQTQKVITPSVEYTWSQSGMNYSSVDKKCLVKSLSSPNIPGAVWFGYIPKWVLQDSRYDPEFMNRLSRGLINMDCIRDITKELLTWNDQNFSEKYPYKFKIVISNKNQRLYGWIDDICTDQKGKMHYLVCFGFIADHDTRYLPNPETLKRKNELISAPKLCK